MCDQSACTQTHPHPLKASSWEPRERTVKATQWSKGSGQNSRLRPLFSLQTNADSNMEANSWMCPFILFGVGLKAFDKSPKQATK